MATLQEYREREHVSFSSLNQFFNCSIQWFFQRIARIQPAYAPVSLALGSAIHRTLEWVHLMRKEERSPPELLICSETFGTARSRRKRTSGSTKTSPRTRVQPRAPV